MNSRTKPVSLLRFLVVVCAVILTASCGLKTHQSLSRLDTPEHHTSTGIRLLERHKFVDAGREFEIALRMDPGYSWALVGKGLARAHQRDFPGGLDALRQAEKVAWSVEARLFLRAAAIRVNTLSHSDCLRIGTECGPDNGWLKNAKEAFDQAVLIDPRDARVHYFMGEAYLTALNLDRAGAMFGWVLEFNREYVQEADSRLRLIRKNRRARPESETGKKIALIERITRAEAAALFLAELSIDSPYAGKRPNGFDTPFRDPEKARGGAAGRTGATDIGSHPLRAEIERMIRIGMRGLEVHPDGSFRPDELVDRATYATMIEDILIRISGDKALATRFIGTRSPFPDLGAGTPYFNAVMAVTSRGIMEAGNAVSGAFLPLEPVAGADALVAIRKMREALRY